MAKVDKSPKPARAPAPSAKKQGKAADPPAAQKPAEGWQRAAKGPMPAGFLWGSATAGEQVERGLHNTDWWQFHGTRDWVGVPNIAGNANPDDGPDFAHINADGTPGGKFREYLQAAKAMGQNAFRFSLEWSRIQPKEGGPYDPNALRLYHAILDECVKDGLTPVVTLDHYDLPIWAHDIQHPEKGLGGWAPPGVTPGKAPIVRDFAQFAGDMAKEYGSQVKEWITLNEPMVLDVATYLAGVFPGGKTLDTDSARAALVNMTYAHAAAYDAIHAAEPDAQVGIAQHYRVYEPKDPKSKADRDAALQWSRFMNGAILDAVTSGNLDSTGEAKFTGPQEGKGIPQLKNRLDFVGVNYYSRDKVEALPVPFQGKQFKLKGVPVTELPVVGGLFKSLPETDSGWEIYPQGMYDSLKDASQYKDAQGHPLAVIVTENGINEQASPDVKRPGFEVEHIEQVQRAMKDGVNVKGFLVWSLMDNFEWNSGFGPRFGLLRVNEADPARPFTETQGAKAYEDIIRAGGVTPELEQKWGPKKK